LPFNSYTFLAFALVVFPLYYALPQRAQNRMLLLASYVFYGAWDYRFLTLILTSTVVDYLVGWKLHETDDPRRRKWLLAASCMVDLGILGFFKYCNFFIESAQGLARWFGMDGGSLRLDIVLPVGISFYTFQSLSYTIDIYRRKMAPQRNLLDFALFVAFFPQLVAGPIERASHLLPQLTRRRRVSPTQLLEGCWLVTRGFFKKIVVADHLAIVVNQIFQAETPPGGLPCLLALYAFAFQIYCDFSGYSDIARGLAKLMGIEVIVNFRRPYLARNPQEFWHRWHISLSTWLRDYLYIPLGGSRKGRGKTYRNLMITMILGGLWHGAAWTFVIWGTLHGVILTLHRWLVVDRGLGPLKTKVADWLAWIGMFHVVCLGWLVFRANDVQQVGVFLRQMVTAMRLDVAAATLMAYLLIFVVPLWILERWADNCDNPATRPGFNCGLGPVVFTALWTAIVLLAPLEAQDFIYFQF